MKTLKTLAFIAFLTPLAAQNLQTIKTYHDPLTKTQLHEVYTVKANTPTKHGTYKAYDINGTLIEEATMANNYINGVHKMYFGYAWNEPSNYLVGKIQLMENFVNGTLVGLSEQYQYINGQKFFLWQRTFDSKGAMIKNVEYHKNGNKAISIQRNGLCNEWYEGGQKQSEYTNKNGEPDGKYCSWYENGNKKDEGMCANGQRAGKWIKYNEDGTILEEVMND